MQTEAKKSRPFRILLAEDHELTRQEMARLIGREPDMVVVADVSTGEAAIEVAEAVEPDFIVLDILLPQKNGIEICRDLSDRLPGVRIVALSNHAGATMVKAFFAAGGMGYVCKAHAFEELVPAIRAILSGRQYLSRQAMQSGLIDARTATA